MTKKYKVRLHDAKAKRKGKPLAAEAFVIYNQYTGEVKAVPDDYVLQDGDIIETGDSYYLDPQTGNPGADAPSGAPLPPEAFSVDVVDSDNEDLVIAPDVLVYSPDPETSNDYLNYPDGADTMDPGYIEVDPSYFDSYEQYYDENDNPVYSGSDCGSSIGIRG